MVQKKLIFII